MGIKLFESYHIVGLLIKEFSSQLICSLVRISLAHYALTNELLIILIARTRS